MNYRRIKLKKFLNSGERFEVVSCYFDDTDRVGTFYADEVANMFKDDLHTFEDYGDYVKIKTFDCINHYYLISKIF